MVGTFPPTIKKEQYNNSNIFEDTDEVCNLVIINQLLESRIRELEAQLETLSPGVTRG